MQVVIETSSGDHMQLHVNNVCLLWYNDKFTCNVDFVWYNSALKSRNKETAFAALETIKRHQMNPYESLFTTTFFCSHDNKDISIECRVERWPIIGVSRANYQLL